MIVLKFKSIIIKLYLDYSDLIVLAGLFLSITMAIGIGFKAKKNIPNIWLVGFLISSAAVIAVKLLYSSGYIIHYPHWFKINYPAGILRPVFIFLYVHFLLNGIAKVRMKHLIHFVPFIILVVYLSPFLFESSAYKLAVLNREIINTEALIPSWYVYFQLSYSLLYLIFMFLDLKKYFKSHQSPSKSQKSLITWTSLILLGGMIYLIIATGLRMMDMTSNYNYYLYEAFSVMLVFLCIKLVSLPELVNANPATNNKYTKSSLSSDDLDNYFAQINKLMTVDRIFKREDLKLKHVAEELEIPEYLISQIVNEKSGRSFRNYLNAFRVEEAQVMLQKSHEQYSIEGIAMEVGFNTRTSFYTAFKKETGLTPSEYLLSGN